MASELFREHWRRLLLCLGAALIAVSSTVGAQQILGPELLWSSTGQCLIALAYTVALAAFGRALTRWGASSAGRAIGFITLGLVPRSFPEEPRPGERRPTTGAHRRRIASSADSDPVRGGGAAFWPRSGKQRGPGPGRRVRERNMRYEWSPSGVEHAVEDAMREYPELSEPFLVAENRDSEDFTWHVELDPMGERRVARLNWQMIEYEQLAEIADALREAEPALVYA